MPREIVGLDPTQLTVSEYVLDTLQPDQIRVKVDFAAPKHGTELHGFKNVPDQTPTYYDAETRCFLKQPLQSAPERSPRRFRPGNMWVGHIVEVGAAVSDFAVGDRVAGYGTLREVQTVRVHQPLEPGLGGINDVLKMTEDMSWKAALCYDPCQFALGGIRDSQLRLGDTCCISGLGAIGMMAAQMARLQGAKTVIVSDPIQKRRELALRYGADYAIDPVNEDAGLRMKELTGKRGVDVVVETSGSYPALQASLRGLTYGGRIAVVGWYGKDRGGFDLGQEAHMNNATLIFSRACSEPNPDYPRWSWARINETCWDLLSKGRILCEDIIDPVVSFEAAGDAYREYVVENPAASVKMGVQY